MKKKKAFTVDSQNIKKSFCTQVIFIMEDKFQKKYFSAKKHYFFGDLCVHFQILLGWECV